MTKDAAAAIIDRVGAGLSDRVAGMEDRLVQTIRDLVRIPSENRPPVGDEGECQRYICTRLGQLGLRAESYDLESVAGLREHASYRRGRNYSGRPNVAAVLPGGGGGRSLLLSGHTDTVPRGSEPWTRDPFSGVREGNRIYGLGSNDMKGGIAAMLIALEALREEGVELKGDLLVETVVDEEFGGVNGTLAGRLRGHNADAAVLCEPSQNVVCPAQTGGRTAHITLRGAGGGILDDGASIVRPTAQLHYLLGKIEEFARQRRQRAPVHPLYRRAADPVPVWVTKIFAGGWGTSEPITVAASCRIELYLQAMPGEEREAIDAEFFDWLDQAVAARPEIFPARPDIHFPIEWLPGSASGGGEDLIRDLSSSYSEVTGDVPIIQGFGGACDLFVFHQVSGTPALVFGPKGGNTHAPDEWVDLPSALLTAQVLARFVVRWCGLHR